MPDSSLKTTERSSQQAADRMSKRNSSAVARLKQDYIRLKKVGAGSTGVELLLMSDSGFSTVRLGFGAAVLLFTDH